MPPAPGAHRPCAGRDAGEAWGTVRRFLLLALTLVLAAPSLALGHAQLVRSSPGDASAGNASPAEVVMEFTEPVSLITPREDVEVVDAKGQSVVASPASVVRDDVKAIQVPLQRDLPDGTYTVRYRIVSADSHIIPGVLTFAVGPGPVGPPNLGGTTSSGPSLTGPWSVSARFFELMGLGGLLGLTLWRWLVWAPAWRGRWTRDLTDEQRQEGLAWGRDVYWMVFGALAVGSMVAEAYLLVVYSASALGTTVSQALTNAQGIGDVLATTRLGTLMQLRGALLFGLFAVGAWQFLAEFGSQAAPKDARPMGPRVPALAMGALLVLVLYGIAAQGHASQAPLAPLQIIADLVHMAGAALWGAGLALTVVALRQLPRRMASGGDQAATGVLARFSNVALWAVMVIVATGVVRAIGQLSAFEQLWQTTYGQVLMLKVALLGAVGPFALYNRRVVNTVERIGHPRVAGLRRVRRAALAEIVGSVALVAIAALLVAEVPGRL